MKFGKKLQELRIKAGYKQPEVAKMMGIEQSYLSKLENDRAIPSREMFEKIIHVFQITPSQIFHDVDPTIIYRDFDHIPWVAEKLNDYEDKTFQHHLKWLMVAMATLVVGSVICISSIGGLIFNNKEYNYVVSYAYNDLELEKGFGQISFHSPNYLGHFLFFGKYGKPLFIYRYDSERYLFRKENQWLVLLGSLLIMLGVAFSIYSRYLRQHEK